MKKQKPSEGATQRQLRAGELVRHALAEVFREVDINDSTMAGEIVTVSEVRMSPDLRHATVFVTTIGAKTNDQVANALNKHQKFLRGELSTRIALKFAPDLVFRADTTGEKVSRIDELLRSPAVLRDLN